MLFYSSLRVSLKLTRADNCPTLNGELIKGLRYPGVTNMNLFRVIDLEKGFIFL